MYKTAALSCIFLVLSLAIVPCVLLAGDDGYVPPQLLRVFYTDKAMLRKLEQAGIDLRCCAAGPGWVDVIVQAGPMRAGHPAYGVLKGFPRVDVRVPNLDVMAERFRDKPDLGLYHTFDEVVDELHGYVRDYPGLASLHELGTTHEGRTVFALKISDNVEQSELNEPAFLICGMHHSREWISVEVVLAFARKLLTGYASDPRIRKIVDNREIWLIPVQNPDGFVYSTTKYRMWRKNRRNNGNGTFGVDPNRNYSYEWGGAGASTSSSSDTYRGPSAASEPITQIIQSFAKAHKNLRGSISFHSYGELVLWPWSYTYDSCPDDAVLGDMARAMARLNGHTPKQSSDLYPSSGDFDDFMYGVCGLASFTFELAQSFIPDEDEIAPICRKNVDSLLWFVENCANPFPMLRHRGLGDTTDQGPFPVVVEFDKRHAAGFEPARFDLYWSHDGGGWNKVRMSPAGGDNYGAEIPGGGTGGYSYYFEAVGKDGRKVRCPETGEFSFNVVDSLYLLVDDDGGRKFEQYYREAFKALGLPVAVLDRSRKAPTLQQLQGATAVVWFCGSESSNTLDRSDQKLLAGYLDNGGKFLLFGQDVGYEIKNSDFFKSYLKARFVKDSSGIKKLEGAAGTFLDGFAFELGGDGVNQSYPEVIEPRTGAVALALYKPGMAGALAVASDAYRLAYFGIGLEGVDGAQARKELLGRCLEWLNGDLGLDIRNGAAMAGRGLDTGGQDARRLAIAGAEKTEALTARLLEQLDAGRYDEVRRVLEPVAKSRRMRPILRTVRRRLAMDRRPGASTLFRTIVDWMR